MLKVGDEIKLKPGLKVGVCAETMGYINTTMICPPKKVTVKALSAGTYDYVGSDGYSYCHEWVVEDPFADARREVEEAQKRAAEAEKKLAEAEKKLADLRDPPVAVGQKRGSGRYVHEILFIDEKTGSAMTHFHDTATPQNAHACLHRSATLKAWPIVP